MSTLRTAAQRALNKFESMGHEDSIFAGEFDEIITALRTALAEPESQADPYRDHWAALAAACERVTGTEQARDLCDAIDRLSAALMAEQEPEQEPVAWGMPRPDGQIVDVITPEEHARVEGDYTVPLYTHPPQRTEPEQEVVHQWRKVGCANWYDGHPDHEDGGGPYEARILYTYPVDDTALLRQALEALKNSRGYIVAEYEQRKTLYEGYPHMAHKYQAEANDLASIDAFITTLKERLGEKK